MSKSLISEFYILSPSQKKEQERKKKLKQKEQKELQFREALATQALAEEKRRGIILWTILSLLVIAVMLVLAWLWLIYWGWNGICEGEGWTFVVYIVLTIAFASPIFVGLGFALDKCIEQIKRNKSDNA